MTLVTSGPGGASCPIRRSSRAVVCVVLLSPLHDARSRSNTRSTAMQTKTCLLLVGLANAATTKKTTPSPPLAVPVCTVEQQIEAPKLLSLWSVFLLNGATTISGMLCGCGSRLWPEMIQRWDMQTHAIKVDKARTRYVLVCMYAHTYRHSTAQHGQPLEGQPALRLLSD
ncbi:hypothetical protein GGI35DRAFT_400710 [Trichoderma velutinum]